MTQAHNGTVVTASQKPWTDNKTGREIVLYSFKIDSSEQWFRTGTDNPNVSEGDIVEFTAKGANVEKGSIKKTGAATNPPTRRSTTGRDSYWADKEQHDKEVRDPRISMAASRHDAVAIVSAALDAGAIPLGSKKQEHLNIILDSVDKVTDRFFLQTMVAHERLKELREEAVAVSSDNYEEAYDE